VSEAEGLRSVAAGGLAALGGAGGRMGATSESEKRRRRTVIRHISCVKSQHG
jgi:hypothetical protein